MFQKVNLLNLSMRIFYYDQQNTNIGQECTSDTHQMSKTKSFRGHKDEIVKCTMCARRVSAKPLTGGVQGQFSMSPPLSRLDLRPCKFHIMTHVCEDVFQIFC